MVTGETDATASPTPDPWNLGFGVVLCVLSLLALFVWFPRDILGSFIETNQVGKVGPGDAFFPVLLASAIFGLSAVYSVTTFLQSRRGSNATAASGRLTAANLGFLVRFHLIALASLLVMYTLGPIVVSASNAFLGTELQYKALVDTVPYKYIGYVVGGCLLTVPLIAWAEGGVRWRSVAIVIATIVALILIFDVLLNNVQLPPNANY